MEAGMPPEVNPWVLSCQAFCFPSERFDFPMGALFWLEFSGWRSWERGLDGRERGWHSE